MKNKLLPTIVLGAICLIVVLVLAAVNGVTAPLIEQAKAEKVQQTLSTVLPDGKNFSELTLTDGLLPAEITNVYTEDGGGYVFQMEVKGYKPGLIIMCGISADGKITGAEVVSSSETMDAEIGLGDRFVGHDIGNTTLELVAGSTATKTTHAYYRAIEAALRGFELMHPNQSTSHYTQEDAQ